VTEATTQEQTANDTAPAAEAAVEDTALATAAQEEGEAEVTPVPKPEGEEEAPAEEAPEGAPETYDTAAFQMPEGIEFDAEAFGEFEPALRELNLTQEQAGKLVGVYAEKLIPLIAKRTTDKFEETGAQIRADMARELQADPEVGGKKLEESRAMAAKAIAHAIPDKNERNEFSTFMNESGFGNHRLLMRLVAGYGRALSEASTLAPATDATPLSTSEIFYGKKG
jgi:hypothetical protein